MAQTKEAVMKVRFSEVGAQKKSWEAELARLDYGELYRAVKKAHALGSRGIDFNYDEEGNERVIFVGGFRAVGRFSVVHEVKAVTP